jgi:hypothetical protein
MAVRWQACLALVFCLVSWGAVAAAEVIRDIRFERQPVFTQEDRDAVPWLPLGLVNGLHVDTRIQVIRRALLFEEGDALDQELLDESARKLRDLSIFAEAEISTVSAPGDSVDVLVRTRELWTTALNIAYDRYEDDTLWTLELREKNFLGTARGFEVSRREDPDRDAWVMGVSDRQMIDGTWAGRLRWATASDGSAIEWRLDREFVQLTGEWAVRMGYRDAQLSPRYYVAEGLYLRPDARRTGAGFEWGHRVRLRENGVWRALGGLQFEYQNFMNQEPLNLWTPSGELPITVDFPQDVPEDRRWNTVYFGLERRPRNFEEARYLFAMGTREDIQLGPEVVARAGWTARWLGSTSSGLWFTLNHGWNTRISKHWLQAIRVNGSGLFGSSDGQDLRLQASFAQYHQPVRSMTLAWGISGGMAKEIDRSDVFHVGIASGLRAARFRELAGDRLLRGNAEFRLIKTSGLFRLITPGVVVFSDFGTAWFEDQSDFTWDQVRGAYGFGFRLGFTRAAADVPIRIDFAWPMLYPTAQPAPVISIGTGHLF